MAIIFLFFFFELVITSLFVNQIVNYELFSLVFICVNAVFVSFYLFAIKPTPYSIILFFAFLLRVLLLFADYYHLFPILHSGGDSEDFHQNAVQIFRMGTFDVPKLTTYPNIIGLIYTFAGPQRMIAQYLNVLFGMGVLLIVQEIVYLLKMSGKSKMRVICITCFLPHAIIFSSILLREAWIQFFLTLSVFYFLKWFYYKKNYFFLLSIFFILVSAYMHSGVIFILIGYLFCFILYDFKQKKSQLSLKSIFPILFVLLLLLAFAYKSDMFTGKFSSLEGKSEEEILTKLSTSSGGGSRYLTWVNVDSPLQLLLYSPLKMFYFQFSPIPIDWRGMSDVITFLLDSIVYFYIVYGIYRNFKYVRDRRDRNLFFFLLISYLFAIFIFSFGTGTAGTALRHRNKLLSVLLLLYIIVLKNKDKYASGKRWITRKRIRR